MDLNLDTLKREILEYLESSGFVVFRSHSGGLQGLPMVTWDTERYPDYQMFLEAARKIGCKMIVFSSRDFDESEIDEALEQLDEGDYPAEDRVEMERRVRAVRAYEGVTCGLEWPSTTMPVCTFTNFVPTGMKSSLAFATRSPATCRCRRRRMMMTRSADFIPITELAWHTPRAGCFQS